MPFKPTEDRPRLIVCGTRNFFDRELVYGTLDVLASGLTDPVVLVGGVKGADGLGYDWALSRGFTVMVFRPDWDRHGKVAGPLRNQEMIDYALERLPAFAVAFWNGQSAGTKDMIARCKKAKIETRIIRFGDTPCRKPSTTDTGRKRSPKSSARTTR